MHTLYFHLPFGSKTLTHLRVSLPWKHLRQELLDEGIELQAGKINPSNLPHADAFVFANVPSLTTIDCALNLKKRGAVIVWTLDDDFFTLPSHNPFSQRISSLHVQALQHALWSSDHVWVTTQYLRDTPLEQKIQYRERVRVVPNLVDLDDYPPCSPRETSVKRCLFAGSITHAHDLELIAEVPARLPDWEFIFMGCMPEALTGYMKDPMTRVISEVPNLENVAYIPPIAYEVYQRTMRDLAAQCSVGIAPLASDEPFNHSKSALKVQEYAALGLTAVASDLTPYQQTRALLVKEDRRPTDIDRWVDAIESATSETAAAQHDWLLDNGCWQSDLKRQMWVDAIRAVFRTPVVVDIRYGVAPDEDEGNSID